MAATAKKKTRAEQGLEKKRKENERNKLKNLAANEMGEFPYKKINWKRRLRAKNDLCYFAQTYFYNVFDKPLAEYHRTLASNIKDVVENGGDQAILLLRGGGKTMWCLAGALHGLLYGHAQWIFFIGANEKKGQEGLATFRMWLNSPLIQQDFPELVYPFMLLEAGEQAGTARSQTYRGFRTKIAVEKERIVFPILQLEKRIASWYQRRDPESVREIKHPGMDPFWIPKGAYAIFTSLGILGSIRGGNVPMPYTFESIRPNAAILDDIQNDKASRSVMTVTKYRDIIDSAVRYLAKRGEKFGILFPATVIESNDLADQLGNRALNPEWRGIRVPMVQKWPEGMSNVDVTDASETSRLWQRYEMEREKSMRIHGDIRDAMKFYRANRAVMDEGFELAWPENYERKYISPVHEAMELRYISHKAFLSNCQQVGGDVLEETQARITARELMHKQAETPRGIVPEDTQKIVGFIDIQDEYFAYVILAVGDNFTGTVVDYGTYPEVGTQFYRRRQMNEWKLLTTAYLKAFPERGRSRETAGNSALDVVEMYSWNLANFLDLLASQKFTRETSGAEVRIHRLAIDAQQGDMAPIVRQVVKKFPADWAIPYHGIGIKGHKMGIDTVSRKPHAVYEDTQNLEANTCRWYYRFYVQSRLYELNADVNAWKDFLFQRLETPAGQSGSFQLFKAPPFQHELFAAQVCGSEKPMAVEVEGKRRNQWNAIPGIDNEFLDCMAGCCAVASLERCVYRPAGVSISGGMESKVQKTFRERLAERKKKGRA